MSSKGKGGKKHRRGKNTTQETKIDLPDELQFFGYVIKILGNLQVNLDYYIPTYCKKTHKLLDWTKKNKIGNIRGKMRKRVFVNLGDIVLVTERDFDDSKVDIIGKFQPSQMGYLKRFVDVPPINELSGTGDIDFEYEGEDGDEDVEYVSNKKQNNKNDDYMSGIPSFSDYEEEDEDEEIETL
jgi:translation initiation factor 1A